jgi:hypothetical protein
MPIINTTIPNLIGGISQQPDRLKYEGQCNDSLNCHASVKDGLIKRNGFSHISKLGDYSFSEDAFVEHINRSIEERYIAVYDNDIGMKVFNADTGVECVLTGDITYFETGDSPEYQSLRATTIADFTFITNNTQEVESTTTSEEDYNNGYIGVFVKQGDYKKRYSVTIDGVTKTYTSLESTNAQNADTSRIAGGLATEVNSIAGVTAQNIGNVIMISKAGGFDNVSVYDGLGGKGLSLVNEQVDDITDLPVNFRGGYIVSVSGSADTNDDDYWVEFVLDDENAADGDFGAGSWVETYDPRAGFSFVNSTMPHTLINTDLNEFEISTFDWSGRTVGDDNTNPEPSVVGKKIEDIFLFKNRLGFIYGNNILMSEVNEYGNFLRTTVTQLTDSDPIDVGVGSAGFVNLNYSVVTSSRLILFSDREQFSLKGEDLLTNSTISITPVTNFESDILVKPVTVGKYTYFLASSSGDVSMREYYLDNLINDFDSNIITSHISNLLPYNVKSVTGTTSKDQVVISTKGSNEYFLYTYHWEGREKKLSSWSRHTLQCDYIVSCKFLDSVLVATVSINGEIHLLKSEFLNDPLSTENYTETPNVLYEEGWIKMDYKVKTEDLTKPTPNQLILPYNVSGAVYSCANNEGVDNQVTDVTANADGTTTLTLLNDVEDGFYAGIPFNMRYELGNIIFKKTASNGQFSNTNRAIKDNLQTMTLAYSDSASFNIEIGRPKRENRIVQFTSDQLGYSNIGEAFLRTGEFRFHVRGKTRDTDIAVTDNSVFPVQLQHIEIERNVISRSR